MELKIYKNKIILFIQIFFIIFNFSINSNANSETKSQTKSQTKSLTKSKSLSKIKSTAESKLEDYSNQNMGISFSKYDNLHDKLKKQNAKTDEINFQLSSNVVGFIYNYNQSLGEKSDSVRNFNCGPNTDICHNFLLQMKKMDSEFSEIKLFKGLFDGVLNKKLFNIDGLPTHIKLNSSEMLCPETLSIPFQDINEFIENLDSDPSKDLKIKYIRNCIQKNNLTKKQQFQLFVKYYNLSLRLEAGFMTTLDQLSLVSNILDQGLKTSLSADNCKGLPLEQQTRCHNLISNCWIGSFGNEVNIYKKKSNGYKFK